MRARKQVSCRGYKRDKDDQDDRSSHFPFFLSLFYACRHGHARARVSNAPSACMPSGKPTQPSLASDRREHAKPCRDMAPGKDHLPSTLLLTLALGQDTNSETTSERGGSVGPLRSSDLCRPLGGLALPGSVWGGAPDNATRGFYVTKLSPIRCYSTPIWRPARGLPANLALTDVEFLRDNNITNALRPIQPSPTAPASLASGLRPETRLGWRHASRGCGLQFLGRFRSKLGFMRDATSWSIQKHGNLLGRIQWNGVYKKSCPPLLCPSSPVVQWSCTYCAGYGVPCPHPRVLCGLRRCCLQSPLLWRGGTVSLDFVVRYQSIPVHIWYRMGFAQKTFCSHLPRAPRVCPQT